MWVLKVCRSRWQAGGLGQLGVAFTPPKFGTVRVLPLHATSSLVPFFQDMAFVGLTERWDESVCLFHRMLPGVVNHPQRL